MLLPYFNKIVSLDQLQALDFWQGSTACHTNYIVSSHTGQIYSKSALLFILWKIQFNIIQQRRVWFRFLRVIYPVELSTTYLLKKVKNIKSSKYHNYLHIDMKSSKMDEITLKHCGKSAAARVLTTTDKKRCSEKIQSQVLVSHPNILRQSWSHFKDKRISGQRQMSVILKFVSNNSIFPCISSLQDLSWSTDHTPMKAKWCFPDITMMYAPKPHI